MQIPHLQLDIKLPELCREELLLIKDYYGLKLNGSITKSTRERYYETSMGHAFRSYAPFATHAYYTRGSKALQIDPKYDKGIFVQTESWDRIPQTTRWLTENLCSEKDLGLVCLHKIKPGGWVDWHSHDPCNLQIVHFSLVTNQSDLSEVQKDNKIYSMNYPELQGFVFNSHLPHRSTNFAPVERIHLVVECSPSNERFQAVYNRAKGLLD